MKTYMPMRVSAAVAIVLLQGAARAQTIVPISATRTLHVESYAYEGMMQDHKAASDAAPDLNRYNNFIGADAQIMSGMGIDVDSQAVASQDSRFDPTDIMVLLHVDTNGSINNDDMMSDQSTNSQGQSDCSMTFTVDKPVCANVNAGLSGATDQLAYAEAQVTFSDDTGAINQEADLTTGGQLNYSNMLVPGVQYTLYVHVLSNASAIDAVEDPFSAANADAQVTVHFVPCPRMPPHRRGK